MRHDRLHTDRHRRTEAVIEILRRRADLRRERGDDVPPALQQAIDDFNREPDSDRRVLKPGPTPRSRARAMPAPRDGVVAPHTGS